jgi:hypothetical protein
LKNTCFNSLFFSILLLLIAIFSSCARNSKSSENAPSDSIIIKIIEDIYTSQNQLDGTEFATTDKVLILDKKTDAKDSTCYVRFHIICSYQAGVRSPGNKVKPPSLDTDASLNLICKDKKWQLKK